MEPTQSSSSDVKRPDKVHPYRYELWSEIVGEDTTSEIMNVLAMILSMVGILMKYKTFAWFSIMVAAAGYTNSRAGGDAKQVMSSFFLAISSVVMCYLTNSAPISASFQPHL